jgi:chromosome partitioning protein
VESVKSRSGFVDSSGVVAVLFDLILDAQVMQIEFRNETSVLGGVWIRGDQLIAAKILEHRGAEAIEALLTQPDLHSYVVYTLQPTDTAGVEPIGSLSEMLYELVSSQPSPAREAETPNTTTGEPSSPVSERQPPKITAEPEVSSLAVEPEGSSDDPEPSSQEPQSSSLDSEPNVAVQVIASNPDAEPLETTVPESSSDEAQPEATVATPEPVPVTADAPTEPSSEHQPVSSSAVDNAEPPTDPTPQSEPMPVPEPVKPTSAPRAAARRQPSNAARASEVAKEPWGKGSAAKGRVLAVVSPKGGVGKTTLSLNLAVAMAQQGHSVVLVDADPQGGVTNSLMPSGDAPSGLYDVLMGRETFSSVVRGTRLETLRLMPAGALLPEEVIARSGQLSNPELWKRVLQTVQRLVDVVIVDTPAGVQGVTTPILAAATHVVAVTQPEPLSLRSLPQLRQTLKSLAKLGSSAQLCGVALNMVAPERPVSLSVLETLSKKMITEDLLLEPMVLRSEAMLKASTAAMPLMFSSDPAFAATKRVFGDLALAILERVGAVGNVQEESSFVLA